MAENEDKKMKVVIAPEALEHMINELGIEETQSILDQIAQAVEDGSFFEQAEEIDMDELMISDPELYARLTSVDSSQISKPTLH